MFLVCSTLSCIVSNQATVSYKPHNFVKCVTGAAVVSNREEHADSRVYALTVCCDLGDGSFVVLHDSFRIPNKPDGVATRAIRVP